MNFASYNSFIFSITQKIRLSLTFRRKDLHSDGSPNKGRVTFIVLLLSVVFTSVTFHRTRIIRRRRKRVYRLRRTVGKELREERFDSKVPGQVHLAQEKDPKDEKAADADAHDEMEVRPLRFL